MTKGVGAVIRGKTSEAPPRIVATADKAIRSCRSSARVKSGSSRACSRVLSCCRSRQAACGRRCESTHYLSDGLAHHDACRDGEVLWHQTVNSSEDCRWKTSLSVEIKQSSRESFLEAGLIVFFVFRDRGGSDGVSEDRLNDLKRE